jgi:hypothetical protein
MQSWPIQLHRLRVNAGGPSKFRKGRFQFSWFLIVSQAFRCWEFERLDEKNDPQAVRRGGQYWLDPKGENIQLKNKSSKPRKCH